MDPCIDPQADTDEECGPYDDDLACTHCCGEGYGEGNNPFWDDCDWSGYGLCKSCNGTGKRKHQWVF